MIHADLAELFVPLACLFEDMHAVTVEGQRADMSPDMARALASHVKAGLASAARLTGVIEAGLP